MSFVPFAGPFRRPGQGTELFCCPLNNTNEKERTSMQAMIDELAKQAEESLGQVSSKETLATAEALSAGEASLFAAVRLPTLSVAAFGVFRSWSF